jgi:hypothetical protein
MIPGSVNPQTKIAVGEVALWILQLNLPAGIAIERLRSAVADLLRNQHENALSYKIDRPMLVAENRAPAVLKGA